MPFNNSIVHIASPWSLRGKDRGEGEDKDWVSDDHCILRDDYSIVSGLFSGFLFHIS